MTIYEFEVKQFYAQLAVSRYPPGPETEGVRP